MTLEVPGMLNAGAKIQYICMLVCGEALHHLDRLSDEVGSTTSEHLESIFGFRSIIFPC